MTVTPSRCTTGLSSAAAGGSRVEITSIDIF
jgi:hypothetical protein